MPGKVIPIKQQKQRISAVVEEALKKNPPDQCPEVINCLKTELEIIIEKYFIDEMPDVSLVLPSDLSREQFINIRDNIQQMFYKYNEQMVARSNAIFHDLYLSKLEICQLKYRHKSLE